jgi:hypothetical protein
MNRFIVSLLCGLAVLSCKSKQSYVTAFNQIDYSFDNSWKVAFSLRLDENGSCIVAKDRSENKQYYLGTVEEGRLRHIDSLYRNVLACNPDSIYNEVAGDAGFYKIVTDRRSFYVYGAKEPSCLSELSKALNGLIDIKLSPIDTVIAFKSLQSFYPPKLKLDTAAFLPPSQQTER